LTHHPPTLRATLAAAGMADSMLREARAHQTETVVYHSRMFPFQVDVNRSAVWYFTFEPRLRHAFIKYGIGSLACGSSLADFTLGVRQTMIAFMNVYVGRDPDGAPKGRLSVEEIAAWLATARRSWGHGAARRAAERAKSRPPGAPS
jgi:hypothetical protein